jgi:predicted RNA-binding Zn-ribbon protein involved in translation (DUF1610 family)
VMWLVSVIFAGFLIGLGNLVIGDLPQVETVVTQEQFLDSRQIAALRTERTTIERRQGEIEDRLAVARLQLEQAQAASTTGTETFEAWIKTRTATTDPQQDPELLARTRALEALKGNERDAQGRIDALDAEKLPLTQRINALSDRESQLNQAAAPAYESALFWQELKVFLYRLLITLPMLALGAWLILKKRKSDYWPIARGFVIAALFVFFVELVPYLPSYGGYIRYIVGIVLTLVAGYYLIRNMRAYLERRQAVEHQAEDERRKLVSHDEAFKKMAARVCPGCDRPVATTGEAETNFCVHCGMTLYNRCPSCDTRKMAFFRHCMVCGTPASEVKAAEAKAAPA